jgi:hypothetical protein
VTAGALREGAGWIVAAVLYVTTAGVVYEQLALDVGPKSRRWVAVFAAVVWFPALIVALLAGALDNLASLWPGRRR